MRLRNIKDADKIIGMSDYLIVNPENYKGKINKLFNNNNPIEIEIGMGKGNFIIEKAKRNPNINFIGIEKYATVLVYAIRKLENVELNNLKIMNIDALNINNYFDKEVSKIYLNFSDPWPKKKHANRRLTSFQFLGKYDEIFKNDCYIEMKTDNKHLYEYSLLSLSQYNYKFKYINLDLYEDIDKENIQTEYESKFVSKQMNIYKLIAEKNDKKCKID